MKPVLILAIILAGALAGYGVKLLVEAEYISKAAGALTLPVIGVLMAWACVRAIERHIYTERRNVSSTSASRRRGNP